MQIFTASWFCKLPPDIKRIGVSRGSPRNQSGYVRYNLLNPGPWFRTASLLEYLRLFGEILDYLDAEHVVEDLARMSGGQDCALLCYERPEHIHAGREFCHRHIAAQWLEDTLGIDVPEFTHPDLDRFAMLRAHRIEAPRFV